MNRRFVLLIALAVLLASPAFSQYPPGYQGSSNLRIQAHLPLGAAFTVADVEVEQELSRPYAYVSRRTSPIGFDVIDLATPTAATVTYSWRIENQELHQGGGYDGKYFKLRGRYYYIQSTQFRRSGPDADVGAIVVDVTSLPDTSRVREAGRIRAPDAPGGFHNIFAYKHSDSRAILFATSGGQAKMYDLGRFLSGDATYGLIAGVPVPETPNALTTSYHDFYVGYDPAARQDKFYGAGGGGYYVFDVSTPEAPVLLTTLTGIAGMNWGHTFTPTPDGRYAIGETEYQYQPLRIFDLKPGLEGERKNVSRPIGAWTADWENLAHNHEVRWPYVFVAGYEDGVHVFNMMDPTNPYTVGYFDTFDGPHNARPGDRGNFTWGVYQGNWGVDVRNADGLIVATDGMTGFWALTMDGFDGWNGHQWGMPNVSSAQDWDNGPDGVPKPARVSTRR